MARDSRALLIAPCRVSVACAPHCGVNPAKLRNHIKTRNLGLATLNIVFTRLLSADVKKATPGWHHTKSHERMTPLVFLRQAREEALAELYFQCKADRDHTAR